MNIKNSICVFASIFECSKVLKEDESYIVNHIFAMYDSFFYQHRVDPNYPIEEVARTVKELM